MSEASSPNPGLWGKVLEELREQIARPSYETWVKKTSLLSAQGSLYQIGVPSKLAKEWLEERFFGIFQETLQEVTGGEATVEFVVSVPNGRRRAQAAAAEVAEVVELATASRQPTNPDLNPKFLFSSFVVGNNSRFANAACRAVAEQPGESYNPLFLYGGVGLGKTHLMHAIGHEVTRLHRNKKVAYVTSEKFLNEVVESILSNKMQEFRTRYRTVDVLLIDDIQFLGGKNRSIEEFFHTFNALYDINKQIVLSSDRPPKEITTLEDRLRSRFEAGLIADIQPPDFETRLAILHSKVGASASLVSEDVLALIAHKVQKNIRELEGALTRVIAYASISGTAIDLNEASRLLADIIPSGPDKPLTISKIQQVVAEYYGISVAEMISKRRDRHIVVPRQIAIYLAREETPSSLPAIGQAFGGRDHTTALHSWDKISGDIGEDSNLASQINGIRSRLASE